jgi:hypothetical protein
VPTVRAALARHAIGNCHYFEASDGSRLASVAAAFEGVADGFLVRVEAVNLGRVDVGDAELHCSLDGADRLGVATTSG